MFISKYEKLNVCGMDDASGMHHGQSPVPPVRMLPYPAHQNSLQ